MSRERIMLTQAIPAVQQLRRVQGFDPLRFLKRNANGGIELEPRYQRLWFRLACPDGKMLLNRLQITDQIAVYEAQVFLSREDNQPITNFTAAVEKAQAPAGRYVQAAQDEALKTALDNAGFGIQLCEINPSAAVDAQADGKQEVATGAVNRQETAPAVNGAAAPQREDPIGESHPVQAVPTPQEVQPQEAAKTPNVNQQEVHTTQQTESVSDAMSLLQALSGGTAASEPDPVMPQKAQEVPSETAEPAVTERAETARTVKSVVVDMPAAASTVPAPRYSDDMTVDEILSLMTEEEAAELVVTTGVNKGWTMAQVSEQRPSSLKYYAYLASKQALTQFDMDAGIRHLRKYAQENDIPIDGIVVTYNDAAYAKSCGRTGHHYKDGLAFKFEDDTYETVLRSIEWTPSRTGEIAPVAIFDTVEIDGCAVSRASLHNLSFIENLELAPGCRIKVSKRNQIIPHVEENLDRDCYAREKVVPARCPCCGQPTRIHTTKNTVNGEEKVTAALFCDNEQCETRKLRKFVHFASQKAMNIVGLSEAILEKFIGKGWLHSYMDIFFLDKHRSEIVQMEGFGVRSWQNLWDAIQHSRITTFEQYLTAMDIPMVGSTASKAICQRFRGNLSEFETAVCMGFDFTQLPDFGETLHRNIHQWFHSEENWTVWTELRLLVCIKTYQPPAVSTDMSNPFVGKTLVVTGKVEPYTRDGINEKIESLGAHAGSSVSSKTDYLICGENAGSKLEKAQELGVKILSPDEFFRMAGESA